MRGSQRSRHSGRAGIALAALLAAGVAATPAVPASTESPCLSLAARQLEVCTAYYANATIAARLPYYKFARDTNPARARLARYRLESRYVGAARRRLAQQVAAWPRGTPNVSRPDVDVLSIRVAADENSAVLRTRETWLVKTDGGRTLFAETNRTHTVELRRLEGLALHKWVVTKIS